MAVQHAPSSSAGTMSISAVVARVRASYPEVSHSSLRFLEREGLLTPRRTQGGHRLYEQKDLDRILRIKGWQKQHLTLDDIRVRLTHLDSLLDPPSLSDLFLQQMLNRKIADAQHTVLAADDVGLPLEQLFGAVLRPALVEVGRSWAEGNLLVAQEKEITELARDLVAELTLRHAAARATGPTVVAACVQDERHELGLRMICGLLRAKGYDVHFLGADVDIRFLIEAVQLHHPAAVLLSAMLGASLSALLDTVDALHDAERTKERNHPLIIVGGSVAIAHRTELQSKGVIPVSSDIPAECVALIEAILPASQPIDHADAEKG